MRTILDILRQRWVLGRPHRAISLSYGRSVGAVHEALRRAREAGLDWAGVETMTDAALEAALYRRPATVGPPRERPQPDCVYLHTERRKAGVTLELLHLDGAGGGLLVRWYCAMRSRHSSASSCCDSGVDPTRSQKSTVSCPALADFGRHPCW